MWVYWVLIVAWKSELLIPLRICEDPSLWIDIHIALEQYLNAEWLFWGKCWLWRSYLDIYLVNELKSPVLTPKYPYGVFLRKNGSLSGLGYQGFLALLVVDYEVVVDLLHVFDCKGGCVWRTWNLWRNVLRSVPGKSESDDGVRSNQFKCGT